MASEVPQYATNTDLRTYYGERCKRSYRLDRLAMAFTDDLLAGRREPKWASDFALLRRADRLRKLREGE